MNLPIYSSVSDLSWKLIGAGLLIVSLGSAACRSRVNPTQDLAKAIQNEDLGGISDALKKGGGINARRPGELSLWDTALLRTFNDPWRSDAPLFAIIESGKLDYNSPGAFGLPLSAAARFTENEAVLLDMLKHGANVNAGNKDLDTALEAATSGNHKTPSIAEWLLKNGADPNKVSTDGVSDLTWILGDEKLRWDDERRIEFASVLLEYGANPLAKSAEGKTIEQMINEWGEPGHKRLIGFVREESRKYQSRVAKCR